MRTCRHWRRTTPERWPNAKWNRPLAWPVYVLNSTVIRTDLNGCVKPNRLILGIMPNAKRPACAVKQASTLFTPTIARIAAIGM